METYNSPQIGRVEICRRDNEKRRLGNFVLMNPTLGRTSLTEELSFHYNVLVVKHKHFGDVKSFFTKLFRCFTNVLPEVFDRCLFLFENCINP